MHPMLNTAIKAARRWGYRVKGIPEGKAEIIACENNFHGRSITTSRLPPAGAGSAAAPRPR